MDTQKRLASLDTLRGFDMMFIMGVASLIVAICQLFPGGGECWLAQQMYHVGWDGLHHHDTIFPLFLFIAGVSFPFSYAKQQARGISKGGIYCKIFRRALILVLLGMVVEGLLQFNFSELRFFSVLGRIGLAWMFAALLYINAKPGTRAVVAAVILAGYCVLCRIPAPDVPGADPLSMEGCLVGYIDRCLFPGHLYEGNFDPEGLLSLLPAIVTAMLGMFAGEVVRGSGSGGRKTLVLLAAAVAMLAAGLVLSRWFPINKKLWSSSFVLVVGAYSMAMFALFYWIIDVKGWDGWTMPFKVIGMNSITIYMAQGIIDFHYTRDYLFGGLAGLMPDAVAKVVLCAGYVAVCWLFLYFLYKKKVFIKI